MSDWHADLERLSLLLGELRDRADSSVTEAPSEGWWRRRLGLGRRLIKRLSLESRAFSSNGAPLRPAHLKQLDAAIARFARLGRLAERGLEALEVCSESGVAGNCVPLPASESASVTTTSVSVSASASSSESQPRCQTVSINASKKGGGDESESESENKNENDRRPPAWSMHT